MFKNFLLSSFRNFRKNRSFTFLNLIGLAVAISGIFTIYVFIQSELAVDQLLSEKETTFLVTYIQKTETSSREVGLGGIETDEWLRSKNSEIVSGHHIRKIGPALMKNQNIKGERNITIAEANFFDYFNIPMISGETSTALSAPNSIVLSISAAKQYFGDSNPIGQTIEIYGDYDMPLQVTGVISDNEDLHFDYDCIISWNSKPTNSPNSIGDWYSRSVVNYIKTSEPITPEKLSAILTTRYQEDFPEDNISVVTYPLSEIYFAISHVQFLPGFKSGNRTNLTILSLIAILILIISIVNYINVNISLVLKRLREIGMRKVMGASKTLLGIQFLVESTLLVLMASFIAITLSDMLIKQLPDLFGHIEGPFDQPSYMLTLVGISLLIGVISGGYPALFISQIKMADGLKSQLSGGKSRNIVRNSLLGIQFVITFGLLIMSVIVYRQFAFIHDKELGFSKDDILILDIGNSGKISSGYKTFQNTINEFPEVKSSSTSTDIIGTGYTNNSYFAIKEGQTNPTENGVMTTYFSVDPSFVSTYNLNLLEGRNFNSELSTDSTGIIINKIVVYISRLIITASIF